MQTNAGFSTQEYRPFYGVFELSDVSRPVVVHQRLKGLRFDAIQFTVDLAAKFSHEVLDQNWNIFRSIAKGWQINSDYVEPVVEILPEATFLNQKLRIAVTR